jgi:hypothetical protein
MPSVEIKSEMKPFFDHAAAAESFRPEMARRLGLRAFTADLDIMNSGIAEFMTHPRQFLMDVYDQLGSGQQAALALVYAAPDGNLESPLAFTEAQRDTLERAGSTPADSARALQALTGSFVQEAGPPLARPGWAFRHPTLWEAFAERRSPAAASSAPA